MQTTIDHIDVEPAPTPPTPVRSQQPVALPPPDHQEIERALQRRRERLDRVRAH